MDPSTVRFYAANAADPARRYIPAGSAPARHFPIAFTPGGRVLDIGCGSGRDLQALLDAGYDARGIDATHEMLREAEARYPALATRLTCGTLPNLSSVDDAAYDGILCWAVLMHPVRGHHPLLVASARNTRRPIRVRSRQARWARPRAQ